MKPPLNPTVLPRLREADYRQFQRMIPELRATSFPEWLADYQKAVRRYRLKNGSKGIPISPIMFAEWLKTNRRTAHLEALWEYAEHKAAQR